MDNAVVRPPTRTMKPHRLMGSPKLGGLNQLNIAQIARVGCKPLHTALRSAPDRGRRIWDASDSGRADTVIDDADRLRDAHRPVVRGIENADLAAATTDDAIFVIGMPSNQRGINAATIAAGSLAGTVTPPTRVPATEINFLRWRACRDRGSSK